MIMFEASPLRDRGRQSFFASNKKALHFGGLFYFQILFNLEMVHQRSVKLHV